MGFFVKFTVLCYIFSFLRVGMEPLSSICPWKLSTHPIYPFHIEFTLHVSVIQYLYLCMHKKRVIRKGINKQDKGELKEDFVKLF